MTNHAPARRRSLPEWLHEGATVRDDAGSTGVVQFIGEWEDPYTRRLHDCAVFLRPPGGGVEWTITDPDTLRRVGN